MHEVTFVIHQLATVFVDLDAEEITFALDRKANQLRFKSNSLGCYVRDLLIVGIWHHNSDRRMSQLSVSAESDFVMCCLGAMTMGHVYSGRSRFRHRAFTFFWGTSARGSLRRTVFSIFIHVTGSTLHCSYRHVRATQIVRKVATTSS